jgi:hypothetical protein
MSAAVASSAAPEIKDAAAPVAGAGVKETVSVDADGLIIESNVAEVYDSFDGMGLRDELLVSVLPTSLLSTTHCSDSFLCSDGAKSPAAPLSAVLCVNYSHVADSICLAARHLWYVGTAAQSNLAPPHLDCFHAYPC